MRLLSQTNFDHFISIHLVYIRNSLTISRERTRTVFKNIEYTKKILVQRIITYDKSDTDSRAQQPRISLKFKPACVEKQKNPKRWIVCLGTGLDTQLNFRALTERLQLIISKFQVHPSFKIKEN